MSSTGTGTAVKTPQAAPPKKSLMALIGKMFYLLLIPFCTAVPENVQMTVSDGADNIQIALSKDGSYDVNIRNITWLTSAPTFFIVEGKTYVQNQNLKLVSNVTTRGADKIGRFVSYTYHYQAGQKEVTTTFKMYTGYQLIYFSQGYVSGVNGTRAQSTDQTISGFPAFRLTSAQAARQDPLGYLAFGGRHCADTAKTSGIVGPNMKLTDGVEGGPLVLFTGRGDVVVVSPASHFMATSHWHRSQNVSASTLSYGVMGGVDHVPAGTTVDFIIYYSSEGVNKAMEKWGSFLRQVYGRTDSYVKGDMTVNYLGYYTDNGAYYYYETEPKRNYQSTMLDVVSYADKLGVPYRYIQYDSWWYYKGVGDGVKTWEPMTDVFPNGLQYMYKKTGLRSAAHNRYWSNDTTYATQNSGRYNFVVESTGKAVPNDQSFWNDLLANASRWGLHTYEQDWLNVEFEGVHALYTDLYLAATWLNQMAQGAVSNNITIQYCMALARHILQTLLNPVVSQARVSHDYHPGNDQWRVGVSSLLAHSLAIAPFKDTFWTTTDQPGNKYKAREPNNELQLIAAVLSTGPVAPSDGIGFTNISLLMRCCNAEGLILKPSKPATMIDDQIYKMAFDKHGSGDGEVWTTYSIISSLTFGIIFVPDVRDQYSITPSMAGFGTNPGLLYVHEAHDVKGLKTFSEQSPLVISGCHPARPCVYYTAPAFNNHPAVILLGELSKVVPISPQRISHIDVSNNNTILHVQGVLEEHVAFTFSVDFVYVTVTCVIPASRTAVLDLNTRSCK